MTSFNKIVLIGKVAFDPDARVTANGDPFLKFCVQADRPTRADSTSGQSDIIQCIAWRELAERAKILQKGELVLVEGRIQTRTLEDNEGHRKYITEVEAREIKSLSNADQPTKTLKRKKPDLLSEIESELEVKDVKETVFDFGDEAVAVFTEAEKTEDGLKDNIPF